MLPSRFCSTELRGLNGIKNKNQQMYKIFLYSFQKLFIGCVAPKVMQLLEVLLNTLNTEPLMINSDFGMTESEARSILILTLAWNKCLCP
jgi:hypothetical protein